MQSSDVALGVKLMRVLVGLALILVLVQDGEARDRLLPPQSSKLRSARRSPPLVPPSQMHRLREFILSAPPSRLAGSQSGLLRSSKIDELVQTARSHSLTPQDVATFAQSVHPRLLSVFEKGAQLPQGFFLTTTRSVQFPEGNPFYSKKVPDATQQRRYRRALSQKLRAVTRLYRKRGGKVFPSAVQLLTSTAHLQASGGSRGDARAIRDAVRAIPIQELAQRQAYLDKLTPEEILEQMPSRHRLAQRKGELVSFDHLLGTLGKKHGGKLLVEIYAENMPDRASVVRYLPVAALGEGSFCVDDIARTTVALLHEHGKPRRSELLQHARAGLRFVKMMQAEDGEFFNFATLHDGQLQVNTQGATSKKGIDFWAGRALWALGEGYATLGAADPEAPQLLSALQRLLPHLERPLARYGQYRVVAGHRLPSWLLNDAADQTAVMLKGLLAFHRGLALGNLRDRVARVITRYVDGLAAAQISDPAAADYGRFIHSITDPNAVHLWGSRQVEILAEAARVVGGPHRQRWLKSARRCADHYWGKATPASITSPGEEQIAYGIETVVSGYAQLYQTTKDPSFARQTYRWASWFFGANKPRALMYDPISGRGYDGIRAIKEGDRTNYTVNANSGAESTVESLLAMQSAALVPGVRGRLWRQLEQVLPE